jgi:antitoxin component of MazEF toxin-antitoxin module
MRRDVKIRRAGNASGITLPRKWLRQLGWKEGDAVRLHLNKSQGLITLQKPKIQKDC